MLASHLYLFEIDCIINEINGHKKQWIRIQLKQTNNNKKYHMHAHDLVHFSTPSLLRVANITGHNANEMRVI
jgi:hypothetical protein